MLACLVLGFMGGGAFGRYSQPGQEMAGNVFGQMVLTFFLITVFAWLTMLVRKTQRRSGYQLGFPCNLPVTLGFAIAAALTVFALMMLQHWNVVYVNERYVGQFTQDGTFWMKAKISLFKAALVAHGFVFGASLSRKPLSIVGGIGVLVILGVALAAGLVYVEAVLRVAPLVSFVFDFGLIAIPFLILFVWGILVFRKVGPTAG